MNNMGIRITQFIDGEWREIITVEGEDGSTFDDLTESIIKLTNGLRKGIISFVSEDGTGVVIPLSAGPVRMSIVPKEEG